MLVVVVVVTGGGETLMTSMTTLITTNIVINHHNNNSRHDTNYNSNDNISRLLFKRIIVQCDSINYTENNIFI